MPEPAAGPPASPTDAHFVVTPRGSLSPPQVAPTIRIGGAPSGATQQVRLTGNWFVGAIAAPGGLRGPGSQLTLDYYDWDGVGNVAWLVRNGAGNQAFVGGQAPDDGTTLDPDTCQDDGTCWESDHIEYVGTDGHDYTASIETFQPATGTPTYSPSDPVEASPVTFSAADLRAGGAPTAASTYSWRFQKLGCGWIECVRHRPGVPAAPSYAGPFEGATVSYTWQSIGPAKVELTATDQHGHSATTVFVVNVGNVAPTALALHENATTVGTEVTLQGVVSDVGQDDDLNIEINFGDGAKKSTKAGPNSIPLFDPAIDRLRLGSEARWGILATTHLYPAGHLLRHVHGVRLGRRHRLRHLHRPGHRPAEDHLPRRRRPRLRRPSSTMAGHRHAVRQPGDLHRRPRLVCEPTGDNGEAIKAGRRRHVHGHRPPGGVPTALPCRADPVQQTFEVTPADLTITAHDQTQGLRRRRPRRTPHPSTAWSTATRRRTSRAIAFAGPPADAGVGEYDITASGAANPNYDISYATGTEKVTPAPLTITADDKTRVYGEDYPAYTASYDGLVNGDGEGDVDGLELTGGAPAGADVGDYPIQVSVRRAPTTPSTSSAAPRRSPRRR